MYKYLKKIGALPNYFKGSFSDIEFYVENQFNIYNNVECIIKDLDNEKIIVIVKENSKVIDIYNKFVIYCNAKTKTEFFEDKKQLIKIKKFISDILNEVKKNNEKNKIYAEKKPVAKKLITKKPVIKKPLKKVYAYNKEKDMLYQALPPGKRLSKEGNVYYENRVNRADKGKLYGLENDNYNFMILLENIETTFVSDLIKDKNYCEKIIFKYQMLITKITNNLINCNVKQKSYCMRLIKKFRIYSDECSEHAKEINKIYNSPL